MQDQRNCQRSIGAGVIALFISGLVTACADPATQPTGPVSQASDSPVPPKDKGSLAAAAPVVQPPAKPDYIVIEPGQSLDRIAHAHHVTPAALAAANQLQPPYKLRAGSKLMLPSSGPPPIQQANASAAARSPTPPPALPPKNEITAAMAPQPIPPAAAPLDGSPKKSAAPPPPQVQAQAALVLPQAPPVLPPRNPAAALPLPGEAP